jgi:hypothetical protein
MPRPEWRFEAVRQEQEADEDEGHELPEIAAAKIIAAAIDACAWVRSNRWFMLDS